MNISNHFTLAEAAKSYNAQRLGIDNTPPDDVIPAIVAVAENILEPVRNEFDYPISPSSWYRSPELNGSTPGSSKTSQHQRGEAVDFEIAQVNNWELAYWCFKNLVFDQLIYEFMVDDDPDAGWIHCSYTNRYENRGIVLRAQHGKGYVSYTPDKP